MKHIWTVLCKKSIIDSDTNNISLNESLEEVTFSVPLNQALEFPVSFNFDFEIVSFWTSDNEKGGEKFFMLIEMNDPEQKVLNKFEQEILFPENKKRLRTRVKIPKLLVTKEGEYSFKIKAKKQQKENFKLLTEIPLNIIVKRTMDAK
jgi:hypothetical protein